MRISKERSKGKWAALHVFTSFLFFILILRLLIYTGLIDGWIIYSLIIMFFFSICSTVFYEARRYSSAEIILTDHWIEHWVRGKKKQVLVLGPEMHIYIDLVVVSRRPITRQFLAIKLYKRGRGSIHIRRIDGWKEEDLKSLWAILYARDKRYRFKYDTDVEIIKKAAAR